MSIPSNSRTTASVIIVNWNGRHWLEQCLPALAVQSFRDFEVIVVDNGSSDGSREWLAEHWPDVRLLPQAANTGFAAGNNAGIRRAQGRYVVTLNNDTRPEGEWLAALVAAAHSPAVGMVASKIVQWQRPDRLDSTGIEVDWLGVAWNRGWGERADTVAPLAVFGPSASAALYRRDMLDGIGLFDDRFFAFYEDVDLAWRAQRAGWRCRFAAEALVHHWHSASTAAIPEQKLFLLGRNRLWCTLKNYPLPGLLRALPLILLYELAATSYQMGRSRSWAPLRGRWAGLKGARRFWRQRDRRYAEPVPLSPLRLRRLASLSG